MSKYLEIIRSAILDVICSQPYEDSLDEDGVINIFDIVLESLSYIEKNWVEHNEYREFIDIISKFNNGENPCTFKMLKELKEFHSETLEECEKDPNWKKFYNYESKGIKPGIYDGF
jgi:hypothetical protein